MVSAVGLSVFKDDCFAAPYAKRYVLVVPKWIIRHKGIGCSGSCVGILIKGVVLDQTLKQCI